MGTPKQGLDYWPRSVDLIKDPKLRLPRMTYGVMAIVVYESLLDLLFRDSGYFIDYRRKNDVLWTVLEDLQGKYQPTAETVEDIITCLVASELFSGDQFEHGMITSKRAQRTFYSSTVQRKAVVVDLGIWLLSEAEMKSLSSNSPILHFYQNQSIERVNQSIERENQSKKVQSKAKQSKVKQSKEKQQDGAFSADVLAVQYAGGDGALLQAMRGFIEMRVQMKKALTEGAFRILCDKLDGFVESGKIRDANRYKAECLHESIFRKWQGVFALKDFEDSAPPTRTAAVADAADDVCVRIVGTNDSLSDLMEG